MAYDSFTIITGAIRISAEGGCIKLYTVYAVSCIRCIAVYAVDDTARAAHREIAVYLYIGGFIV